MLEEIPPKQPTQYMITLEEVLGYFAMWAVRQSPYTVPPNLEKAIAEFKTSIEPEFDKGIPAFRVKTVTKQQLKTLLINHLNSSPTVAAWGIPRNREAAAMATGYVFTSRYSRLPEDDDAVDLDALTQNITMGILIENLLEEQEGSDRIGWHDL